MMMSVQAETIYDSPYVKFAPDGQAFTTNAGEKNYKWYDNGTTVNTGKTSSMRALEIGEHYYKASRSGSVPISKWEVSFRTGSCCHNGYPDEDVPYHGINYSRQSCAAAGRTGYYYSGWGALCADCGDSLTHGLIYMSKEAAQSITELDMGNGLEYYYLCPHCNNLEQGYVLKEHICDKISYNRYMVNYNVNTASFGGYMSNSIHMYNNAIEYEGETITPATCLTKNTYTRTGYEFMGWNTKADGSGTWYEDGQAVLNLTAENYDTYDSGIGIVSLYAQWEKSESTLNINPNGGKYDGNSGISSFVNEYGSEYYADSSKLQSPFGYTVSFDVKGGNAVSSITGTRTFQEWSMKLPFKGRFINNTYYYIGKDGTSDTITAIYNYNSITLPSAGKTGSSFGGWYYDSACTNPAGGSGDKITPNKDITLYAKWVDLVLYSKNNYTANGGKGAVDLSWEQNDGNSKTYMLYQSQDNINWTKISGSQDISNSNSVNNIYQYTGTSKTYIVPYTGVYTINAYGAQGGNYSTYTGGAGGKTTITTWLKQGEIVTYNIGSQNGYNGGGSGSTYGSGGGTTTVSTSLKGTLLIAGGGGGASSMGNGGAGGSTTSNISTGISGQSGHAGGGGGHMGGSAGELIQHWHNNNVCRHNHTGDAIKGGGCYTVQKICGSASFNAVSDGSTTYYGNRYYDSATGKWKSDGYCPRCGTKGSCVGHTDNHYKYVCASCGKDFGRSKPASCNNQYGYTIGCGRNENYICGYTNGQVLSSKPAYGGSNYINTSHAISYSQASGQKSGNGAVSIMSSSIGYLDLLSLSAVTATDKAAPDAVNLSKVGKSAVGETQVKVTWQEPADHGTVYYHRVESYLQRSTSRLSISNTTINTLVSGIKGYYYLLDGTPGTVVNNGNGTFQKKSSVPAVILTLTQNIQYLHIAAVDAADNIGATIHIPVGTKDAEVAWNLKTEKIVISSANNSIYPAAADTYYVKTDGTAPFTLSFNSRTEQALDNYQVNHTIFYAEEISGTKEQEIRIYTENHAITNGSITTKADKLQRYVSGTSILQDAAYTVTTRNDYNKRLHIAHRFTISSEYHGKKIRVTPIAGADFGEDIKYSTIEEDKKNSIYLIGDGKAPDIAGLELLGGLNLIDRNAGDFTINLTASDDLSGVKEFYVEIYNTDNATLKSWQSDAAGKISIVLTDNEPIFSGDFTITIYAADNVGNNRTEVYGATEFALTTKVTRILEPHDPKFKTGESGILNIITFGYADRVEVIFPEAMTALNPDLNTTFYYEDTPAYCQEENLQFMVPLYTPSNENFTITVRAYKEGKQLEDHPSISIIEINESVLGEIRTRLR